MTYEKECKTCGKTLEISNELRRKGKISTYSYLDNKKQVIESTDIYGDTVYKTNIDLTLGKCHDMSDYYCSKECMDKRETAKQL